MIRRSFLRRMALAAAACAFLDVPWPKERGYTLTREGIRNVIEVVYHDSYGREEVVLRGDSASMQNYGVRKMRIGDVPHVFHRDQAGALADAVLADMAWPTR